MSTHTRFLALLSLCVLVVTTGCQMSAQQRRHIPTEVRTDEASVGRPTLGTPIMLPESDVFVVPFTLDRPMKWLERSDRFDMSKSIAADREAYYGYNSFGSVGMSRTVRWHNAVFQTRGGQGRLALDRRGMISRFEFAGPWIEEGKGEEKRNVFHPKAVMLLATVEDTDGDKQLTSADANILLAGDKDGNGMHPITPSGTQVWSTQYSEKHDLILIIVVSDTNGDKLFSSADSSAPYVYKPGTEGMAKPLVDSSLVEQAEKLLK